MIPGVWRDNSLKPNDHYRSRTAQLTSKRFILYIYSTNIGTEYFKHGIYSPFLPLQNAVCFIILTYLVPLLFTFYIQCMLKLKTNSGAKTLLESLISRVSLPLKWEIHGGKRHRSRCNNNSFRSRKSSSAKNRNAIYLWAIRLGAGRDLASGLRIQTGFYPFLLYLRYHPGHRSFIWKVKVKGRDPSFGNECTFVSKSVLRSPSLRLLGIPKKNT